MNRSFVLRSIILSTIYLAFLCYTSHGLQLYSKRLWGNDRYKTAAAISQYGWEKSEYAVLARGDDFADALCAGPLAKKYDAPILLTETEELGHDVLMELIRLEVNNVIIVGGPGAVSYAVEESIKSLGIMKVYRIWGADRYETAVSIAEELGVCSKVALASGDDFPDALSISSIASALSMPILLTGRDSLPGCVKRYIEGQSLSCAYIIGGTGVISSSMEEILPNPVRLGGRDRYETNVRVIEEFAGQLNFGSMYVAVGDGPRGNEFADALAGAVLAAKSRSPVILVHGSLAEVTGKLIKPRITDGGVVIALGGEGAVPERVVKEILSYGDEAQERAESSYGSDTPAYNEENPVKISWDDDGIDGGEKIFNASEGDMVDIVFYAVDNSDSAGAVEVLRFVMKWQSLEGSSIQDISILEGASQINGGMCYIDGDTHSLVDKGSICFRVRVRFHKAGRYGLTINAVKD